MMNEEAKAKFDALKVGDILVSSSHYYGVFYDFYKIIGKTECSLKLQALKKVGSGDYQSASYRVIPTDEVCGKVLSKRPDKNGFINFPYRYCSVESLYDPNDSYCEDHGY